MNQCDKFVLVGHYPPYCSKFNPIDVSARFSALAIDGLSGKTKTHDHLLEFECMLETDPEVYDHCSNMTDEQLNQLIAFLSRNKENIFLELGHMRRERDEARQESASKDSP